MVFLYLNRPGKEVDLFSVSVEHGEIEKIDQDEFRAMSLSILKLGTNPDSSIRRHFITGQGFELMLIDTGERERG